MIIIIILIHGSYFIGHSPKSVQFYDFRIKKSLDGKKVAFSLILKREKYEQNFK